jgi:hypothetical protein
MSRTDTPAPPLAVDVAVVLTAIVRPGPLADSAAGPADRETPKLTRRGRRRTCTPGQTKEAAPAGCSGWSGPAPSQPRSSAPRGAISG